MIYRHSVVFCLAIAVCSCASKPTAEALEAAEIGRVLDKARATDLPTLRTCQSLVIDLEGKPVADYVAPGVALVVAQVVAFVVLFPVVVADALANSRANARARDRIIARCVVAVSTEQRVGPDHVDMAVPLVRLSEAYQLAAIDPKGLAVQQAQRLFERAVSLVEKELDRVEKDEEYGEQIEGALTSYISLLKQLNRDWRPVCSRFQRLRFATVCNLD